LLTPLLVFNGLLLLSLGLSLSPYWSFWGSYERSQGVFTWLTLGLFIYLIYRFRVQTGFNDLVQSGLVLGSVPVVCYALLQACGLDPWQWDIEIGSSPVFGTLGRSNYLASYLVLVLPLTLKQFVCARQTRWRMGWGLLIAAQGLALLLSHSRGGWLTLGVISVIGLVAWGVLQHNRRWQIMGFMLGGVSIMVLLILNLPGDVAESLKGIPFLAQLSTLHITDAGSLAARLTIWKATLKLIGQRPLLGHGPGTFALAFARVYPPELVYYQGREVMVDHAHNLWLQIGVECGLLGMLALLVLYGMFWGAGVRSLLAEHRPDMRFQVFCLLMAVLANALMDLLQPATASTLIITWALYGLLLPPPAAEKRALRPRHQLPLKQQWPAMASATMGIVVLVICCIRPALADRQFTLGLRQADLDSVYRAQHWMPRQDAYFHKAGRMMADLRTQEGFISAEQQFLRAIELCPAQPLYWADLGTLYLAWANYDITRLDKAEAAYRQALELGNDQALWLRGLGQVYFLRGEEEEAEALFRKVVALDATDAQAYMRLGDLYYVQERYPDAVLAYTNAYRWWPDSALPLAGLGRAYYRSGQCGEALYPLEQSLQIEPTGPLTYQALAACYLELGQVDKAITVIHDGLKKYPQDDSLLGMLP